MNGNRLVDGSGAPLRLLGVDHAGTDYACIQGWGIFDGPSDGASIAAMTSWFPSPSPLPPPAVRVYAPAAGTTIAEPVLAEPPANV